MTITDFEKSDRLKELAPDIEGYVNDLQDVNHLLGMMTELLNKDGDLEEETIARSLSLWRSAWPLLEQAVTELGSINSELKKWK